MKKVKLVFLLFAFGCAVQVKTYQNPVKNFDDYATWCWLKGCEITYQGPEHYRDQKVIDEMANAIAFQMYDKGYQQADDSSDLMVNFYLVMKEDSAEVFDGYDDSMMPEFGWMDRLYPEYEKYLKGSLVIDIIDRRKSEIVWRSTAVRYMDTNPIYDKDEIWSGVAKAMKKLPERIKK